ncbi:MAG: GNAT family N-acetyltransferase [Acidobacteria bacterium]|nr:GNAT family N-acetyltransferase [Acidobacteriota bacterium]
MSDSVWWLQTERLALRRFVADDLDWLVQLYRDVEVARHLGGLLDRATVETMFRGRFLGYYDLHPGLGIWATLDRVTGELLGFHLLNNIQGESIIQLGYGLARSAWGRGLATEMAVALVRYGFEDLRLPRISGMAGLENLASQRVLLKSGLHRNGERAFPHPAYAAEGPMAWFERDRDAWLAEHAADARSVFDAHRR